MIAKDIMDPNFVTVNEQETLEKVFAVARVHRIGDLVVVDSSADYRGMLFEAELLDQLYRETKKIGTSRNIEFHKILNEEIRHMPVRRFMNTGFLPFTPEETLEHMAERMLFEKMPRMAVVDQGMRVVGSISLSRILSGLMEQRLAQEADARKGPAAPGKNATDEIETAQNKRFFQRMPFSAPLAYRLSCADKKEASGGKIAQTINISAGGLLVLTEEKLVPNNDLHVALDLYQNNQPIRMICRIVRCLPASRPGYFEVGLMFVAIGIEERRRLDEHLKKQMLSENS